jgi:asparagine synthase (glutamine-hydrolysing)
MSGLCGIINFDATPVDPELPRKMAEVSAFRGPDGLHYWVEGHVGLANLALHVTSKSVREKQPLVNRRGDLVLTADARVDNRPELIETLTSNGALDDKDPTDADLILAAYESWGEACPDHVVGDFAFAIWDVSERKLFCARDAVGARLFSYYLAGNTIRFASDPGQILADEKICKDLDGYYLADLLTGNTRDQARTVFANIQNLLPGHAMVVENGKATAWRYWHPDRCPPIYYKHDAEYVDHFRDLLLRCVSDRMRSRQGRIGITVSGGVDSSGVAAIAQHLYKTGQVTTQPVAFHFAFSKWPKCDERAYATALAEETGITLQKIPAEDYYFLDGMANYAPRLDTVGFGTASLTHALYEKARSCGCDGMLNGFGGDSLFDAAKFRYFDEMRQGRWWRVWPWVLAGRREGRSWPSLIRAYCLWPSVPARLRYRIDQWRGRSRYHQVPNWIHPEFAAKSGMGQRLYAQFRHERPQSIRDGMRYMQVEHIVRLAQQGEAITRRNRETTQFGMHEAFPLLDRRLAEFVLAAPFRLGASPGMVGTKWILRAALRGILPETVRLRQGKSGWGPYWSDMWCNRASSEARSLLTNTRMAGYRMVIDEVLQQEYDYANRNANGAGLSILVPILVEYWLRNCGLNNSLVCFPKLQPWQLETLW